MFGLTTPGVILVASFLFGTTLAFGMPVFQAIVPDLVPREELAPAVSLNSIGINVARVIGPALGGLMILGLGVGSPFFVNTIFYLAVVATLLRWLPRLAQPRRDGGWIVQAVVNGVRHTLGMATIRATLIRSGGYAFFASLYFSLLPLVARDQVSGGAGTYGLLLGCLGAGGIAAVVLLPRWRMRFSPDRIARVGSYASALFLAALGGCRGLWSVVPVLLLAGIAWVAVLATVNVAAQIVLPAWVRARPLDLHDRLQRDDGARQRVLGRRCEPRGHPRDPHRRRRRPPRLRPLHACAGASPATRPVKSGRRTFHRWDQAILPSAAGFLFNWANRCVTGVLIYGRASAVGAECEGA